MQEQQKIHIYNTTPTSQDTTDTLQRYKEKRKAKIVSDYGQDTNWTKSPEDNQGVHIPAQAKPEGFPS